MTEYRVSAHRIDSHGSVARAKDSEVVLDTDMTGRDEMNPVELLLSALAACMLKGIERVTPMLAFQIVGTEVALEAIRQSASTAPRCKFNKCLVAPPTRFNCSAIDTTQSGTY